MPFHTRLKGRVLAKLTSLSSLSLSQALSCFGHVRPKVPYPQDELLSGWELLTHDHAAHKARHSVDGHAQLLSQALLDLDAVLSEPMQQKP